MSRRRKLEKFEQVLHFDHVFEMIEPGNPTLRKNPQEQVKLSGQWRQKVFGNTNPLCVELACGRGEYCLALATKNPDINYIGVDIKGARIWKGASQALEQGLSNVAFLRIRIEYISLYFAPGEMDEVWITFPDPFPDKANRRILHPRNMEPIQALIRKEGRLHLKTDDEDYFLYAVQQLCYNPAWTEELRYNDVYKESDDARLTGVQTYYEKIHLKNNKTIKYLLLSKNS